LHKNFALLYEQQGNIGEAEKQLHIVLTLTPDDADARKTLAGLEKR